MTKAALVGAVCFLFGAMTLSRAAEERGQCADVPVKYLNCDKDGSTDCFLVARFPDMQTCESYRDRDMWYCDTVSKPGKADCDTRPLPGRAAISKCVR